MLDEREQPHLMDFGLAARHDLAEKLTHDGAILGTPAYMAPEQAGGQQGEAQPASDQYGLGVVLYELLCGRLPFAGPPHIVLFNAVHTEPTPPSRVKAGVPLDLETICLKALAKQPGDRYADCRELADDLRRWLEGEPIQARRQGVVERALRWFRREPVVALTATVALLCLVAVAVVASVSAQQLAESAQVAEEARLKAEQSLANAREAQQATEVQRQKTVLALTDATEARRRAEANLEEAEQQRTRALAAQARAEAEWRRAEEQRFRAEAERQRAEGERQTAEEERQKAQDALAEVERQRGKNEGLQTKADCERYANLLAQAKAHIARDEWQKADKALNACRADMRGWEWRHLKLRTVPRKTFFGKLSIPQAAGTDLHFSPDNALLITRTNSSKLAFWSTRTWQPRSIFVPGRAMAFSPDGKLMAWTDWKVEGKADLLTFKLWDMPEGKERKLSWLAVEFARDGQAKYKKQCLALAPERNQLAFAIGQDPATFDLKRPAKHLPLAKQSSDVQELCFSPDGTRLACATAAGTGMVWDSATGKELLTVKAPAGKASRVAFSRDGGLLALFYNEQPQIVVDVATGKPSEQVSPLLVRKLVYSPYSAHGQNWAMSPDGQTIAKGNRGVEVTCYHAASGIAVYSLNHTGPVENVAFSPDGSTLACFCSDHTVKLWFAEPVK
jgi:WD40 repeat protein